MTATGRNLSGARIGLALGPLIASFVAAISMANGVEFDISAVAAIAILMAIWWMTEALPLAATALVPVVAFPLLGIMEMGDLGESYAHPLVFLFLGGFLIGQAMQSRGLSEALALLVLARVGSTPRVALAGLIGITAFLSLWISNTASAMIMVPIGLAVAAGYDRQGSKASTFRTAMVLGVAYAATIGGMGSLIGTPPNALFAAFMADSYGIEISFARWLLVGLPVIFILLPVMWLVVSLLFLRGLRDETSHSISPPPAFNPAMRRVALIAGLAALAWLLRPLMMSIWPELGLSDGGIAIVAAIALFVTSSGEGDGAPLLTWHEAAAIRWDVLMLFGGGLALAAGIEASGLSQALAESAIQGEAWPVLALLVVVVIGVVLVGELASNTAMAAVLFPIAGATLGGTGSPPLELLLPLALATSIGFMLPVATPPNAIAFGGGKMVMADMIRAGAILDILAIAIVVPTALVLGRIVFG